MTTSGLSRSTSSGRAHGRRRPKSTWKAIAAGPRLNLVAYVGLIGWVVATTTYLIPGAQAIIAIALAAMIADLLLQGRVPDIGGRVGIALLVYLFALVVATPLSIWLGRSVGALQEAAKLVVIFFLALHTVRSRARLDFVLKLTVALVALFPARGAIQEYLARGGRADWINTYGNSNVLAAILVMFVPFAIAWLWTDRRISRRLFWAGCALLMLVGILVTQSRSGLLGLVILVGWLGWASRDRVGLGIVLGAVVIVLGFLAPSGLTDRLESIQYTFTGGRAPIEEATDVSNIDSRLTIWKAALDIVSDYPVLGVGPGAFEEAHRRYQRKEGWSGGALWMDTHNAYLRVWAETGTIGLLAFLGMLASVLTTLRRAVIPTARRFGRQDTDAILMTGCMAGFLGFLVSNFFNTFLDIWHLYFFMAIAVLLARGAQQRLGAFPPMPARGRR